MEGICIKNITIEHIKRVHFHRIWISNDITRATSSHTSQIRTYQQHVIISLHLPPTQTVNSPHLHCNLTIFTSGLNPFELKFYSLLTIYVFAFDFLLRVDHVILDSDFVCHVTFLLKLSNPLYFVGLSHLVRFILSFILISFISLSILYRVLSIPVSCSRFSLFQSRSHVRCSSLLPNSSGTAPCLELCI